MKKIILIVFFKILFIPINATSSNVLSHEITLLLNYNYDWAPNYVLVIHVDNTGLLKMSVGQLYNPCYYWDNNTFNYIQDCYLSESYKLDKEEITELNKLLDNEETLCFIDEDRVLSGLQYVIYLDGVLSFKLSRFYFEHSTEVFEIEGVPYPKIIEKNKEIIDILTKRIENEFNLF